MDGLFNSPTIEATRFLMLNHLEIGNGLVFYFFAMEIYMEP